MKSKYNKKGKESKYELSFFLDDDRRHQLISFACRKIFGCTNFIHLKSEYKIRRSKAYPGEPKESCFATLFSWPYYYNIMEVINL